MDVQAYSYVLAPTTEGTDLEKMNYINHTLVMYKRKSALGILERI